MVMLSSALYYHILCIPAFRLGCVQAKADVTQTLNIMLNVPAVFLIYTVQLCMFCVRSLLPAHTCLEARDLIIQCTDRQPSHPLWLVVSFCFELTTTHPFIARCLCMSMIWSSEDGSHYT